MSNTRSTHRSALLKAAKQKTRARNKEKNAKEKARHEEGIGGFGGVEGPIVAEPRSLTRDEVRQELLAALRVNPVTAAALRSIDASRSSYDHAIRIDPDFSAAVDSAKIEGWERLEEAAFTQALANSEPGNNTHKLKEFLLKGRKRRVYGDKLSVQSETRHTVEINLVPALPPAQSTAGAVGPGGRAPEVIEAEIVESEEP